MYAMAESDLKELLALVEDTTEYALYLRELGVKGIEEQGAGTEARLPAVSTEARHKTISAAPPVPETLAALRRNAVRASEVEQKSLNETISSPTTVSVAQHPAEKESTRTGSEQTEMAKKKKYPDPQPPPPMETLFGTITPQDEESLPRSNETLEDIWNDIGECMRCPLSQSRTRIVNSEGNRQARLMFIGEAPGADEDASGRPFVGRAGQLLNKIIEAIGLKREDIMIGNVNRCRPPQNRTPTPAEAATCKPFLLREIAIIRPDVIVVLGNTAMKNLLDTKEGITKLRGKFQDYRGIKVMPTFHPAYLLRDPSKKREAWEDMKMVRDYLNTVTSEK
jgi:uracil-DNA glycosylase family 4